MSDNISRQAAIDAVNGLEYIQDYVKDYVNSAIAQVPSTDRTGHWMSFEQVADMLSGMFGKCACDVNGNDEWLPLACKYADTECPHPKEENGCWMQFLLQGGADMRGVDDESTL